MQDIVKNLYHISIYLHTFSHEERMELSATTNFEELTSNGLDELNEFLEKIDLSLREAQSDEEKCSRILDQLRQKVEQYPENVGKSE